MKKFYFLFLLASAVSCRKNEVRVLEKEIIGNWEFEKSIGYPFNLPALPPGNGKIIVIGKNGDFERRQHDTLLFKGNYLIRKKADCHERPSDLIFSTNENSSPGDYQYIEIIYGKLTLSTPNCYVDGGTAYYRKLE